MGITSNNEERTYLLDKCEKGELPIKVGMLERKRRSKALKKFYEDQRDLSEICQKDSHMLKHVDTQELIKQGQLDRKEQLRGDRYFATIVFVSNVIILSGNFTASILSGSISIISVFIDSLIDLASSTVVHVTIWSINNTNKFNYPRGKHRLGLMAIISCSIFMGVANLMLIIRSVEAIISNQIDPEANLPTLVIMLTSIFVKLIIMVVCYRHGTKNTQMIGMDQRNDAITSMVGLAGAYIGDRFWGYADPVGAILVCTFVAVSWFHNAVEQFPLIVGKRMDKRELSRILAIALDHDERIKAISYVSVYHVGEQAEVELHIVLDSETPLHVSHKISENLRDKINALSFVERAFVHVICEE